jgi:hypothetical protein
VPFLNNSSCASPIPKAIKNKLIVCKSLLHIIRQNPSEVTKARIKNLHEEINNYYFGKTSMRVRHSLLPLELFKFMGYS